MYAHDNKARDAFYEAFGLNESANDYSILDEVFAQADRQARKSRIVEAKEYIEANHNKWRAKKESKLHYLKNIAHRFIVSMMVIGAILGVCIGGVQVLRFHGPIVTETGVFGTCLIAIGAGVVTALILGVFSHIAITTIVNCLQAELDADSTL